MFKSGFQLSPDISFFFLIDLFRLIGETNHVSFARNSPALCVGYMHLLRVLIGPLSLL